MIRSRTGGRVRRRYRRERFFTPLEMATGSCTVQVVLGRRKAEAQLKMVVLLRRLRAVPADKCLPVRNFTIAPRALSCSRLCVTEPGRATTPEGGPPLRYVKCASGSAPTAGELGGPGEGMEVARS